MKRTILITGATDGIGLELARLHHAKGHRLVLVGRKPLAKLDAELFTKNTYCQADLQKTDSHEKIALFLQQQNIKAIDQALLNAATGYYGPIQEQSDDSIDSLLQVNTYSPISLAHSLIPFLRPSRGKLVLISSVVATLPAPDFAVYAASKAALDGFARSLRLEHSDISVQVIAPGATNSGLHGKIGVDKQQLDWDKFSSAKQVAQSVYRASQSSSAHKTIGVGNALARSSGSKFASSIDYVVGKKSGQPLHSSKKTDSICVITGAADGIGRALAYRFGRAGYKVVGVDIDKQKADATKQALADEGVSSEFIICDMSAKAALKKLSKQLANYKQIDIMIHNAGISAVGRFAEQALAKQRQVLDVNLRAPIMITASLLANKQLSTASSLIFVSSASHFVSYPGAAAYAASKDGIASYARSLRAAFRQKPHVLTVFPGPTKTVHAERYSPKGSDASKRMSPDKLADKVYGAYIKKRSTLIPGVGIKAFATLGRWAPAVTEKAMVKTILDKL